MWSLSRVAGCLLLAGFATASCGVAQDPDEQQSSSLRARALVLVTEGLHGPGSSFTESIDFAYFFQPGEEKEIERRSSGHNTIHLETPVRVPPGTVYGTKWTYAGIPDGRQYVLAYGQTADSWYEHEYDRYLTLPLDVSAIGLDPLQGRVTPVAMLSVLSFLAIVDSLDLPSTAIASSDQRITDLFLARDVEVAVEHLEGSSFHPRVDRYVFPRDGLIESYFIVAWGPEPHPDEDSIHFFGTEAPTGPLRASFNIDGYETPDRVLHGAPHRSFSLLLPLVSTTTARGASEALADTSGPLAPPPLWLMDMALDAYLAGEALLFLDLFEACDLDGDGELTENDRGLLDELMEE